MKIINWITVILTFAFAAWILIEFLVWKSEWVDLFFYQDNWLMWIFLFLIAGTIIKMVFEQIIKMELRIFR